uniref:Uncharacterized protein n=1 Tax=Oryza meridionalis TaxID=40149 RepID=A0A0E0DM38_9ORYZ
MRKHQHLLLPISISMKLVLAYVSVVLGVQVIPRSVTLQGFEGTEALCLLWTSALGTVIGYGEEMIHYVGWEKFHSNKGDRDIGGSGSNGFSPSDVKAVSGEALVQKKAISIYLLNKFMNTCPTPICSWWSWSLTQCARSYMKPSAKSFETMFRSAIPKRICFGGMKKKNAKGHPIISHATERCAAGVLQPVGTSN